ncbi:hypothetical protein RRG08_017245 [Elysia crispata]|uniref:Uncharacterized protein n=1 Tax=Elysia crispata TaxID=231223 RepID=A0AAE0XSZ8_9GAST|nr:hypothetical protein RRG08_017245 [Elysia crispata]
MWSEALPQTCQDDELCARWTVLERDQEIAMPLYCLGLTLEDARLRALHGYAQSGSGSRGKSNSSGRKTGRKRAGALEEEESPGRIKYARPITSVAWQRTCDPITLCLTSLNNLDRFDSSHTEPAISVYNQSLDRIYKRCVYHDHWLAHWSYHKVYESGIWIHPSAPLSAQLDSLSDQAGGIHQGSSEVVKSGPENSLHVIKSGAECMSGYTESRVRYSWGRMKTGIWRQHARETLVMSSRLD